MSVTLLRPYQGFATGAVITLQNDVETAMIAQGLATAGPVSTMANYPAGVYQSVAIGGNQGFNPAGQAGFGTPAFLQGSSILSPAVTGSVALTAVGGVSAHTAGTLNISEIFVPYWNTWKGIGVLNGTVTVGTDNMLVALYGSNGALLANSAVAGTLSATVSVFQNRDFLTAITLAPGRYFCAVQSNGTTATTMKYVAANGSNVITTSVAGTFGTVPATITVPTTFTTAVGCVCQLYTV